MKLPTFKKLNQNGFDHVLIAVAFIAVTGVIGVGYFVIKGHRTAGTAQAFSQTNQMCTGNATVPFTKCLNAWGGGPAINVYGPGTNNDNFKTIGTSYDNLEFVGGGSHNGWCIGDSGSNPNSARAALVPGCTSGQIGWGVNFTSNLCYVNGKYAGISLYNVHWKGYLGPETSSIGTVLNGFAFYLNKPTPWCFKNFAV